MNYTNIVRQLTTTFKLLMCLSGVPEVKNGVNSTQIEDSLPVSASNCITVDQTTKLYDSP